MESKTFEYIRFVYNLVKVHHLYHQTPETEPEKIVNWDEVTILISNNEY